MTSLPEECRWPLGLVTDIEADGRTGSVVLDIAIYGPHGDDAIANETVTVQVPESEGIARVPAVCGLRVRVDVVGEHTIAISRLGQELAQLPIQVHQDGQREASASR